MVRFYEQGSNTPAATSAPTNKMGNLTPVKVSRLKPYTTYNVEVTDEISNMGCGLTEPKNVRSVITNSASGSFVRNISLDTWRPKKIAEPFRVASGFVTVEIDNAKAGAGPFTVTITNHDTGVTLATQSINKAAGASTTAYITPSGSQKFEGNNRYNIKVTDGSCSKTKQLGYSYGYSARTLKLFLVPSLSCTNCNLFDFAFAADYTHEGARPNYYPFLITVQIQRGGTTLPLIQYTNSEALSKNRVGKYHVYGNNEFGFWNWWDPMVYKVGTQIRVGDVITVTYQDSNNVTHTATHTVSPPTSLPVTLLYTGPKSGGGPCDKVVLLKTYLQTGYGGAYYNSFCNTAGIKYRVKVGGSWVTPPAGNTSQSGSLFRYFNEVNNNEHVITVQNALASTYQVEYAGATGSLDGSTTKDCKHYQSQDFTSAQVNAINPLANLISNISVGGTPSQTLERTPTGNKVYIGSSDPDYTGLKFITATNKLTVKLERLDNSSNVINGKVTMNVTGPGNLAGNYTVTFPYVKQVWPGNNNGTDYIYQFMDVPVGKYKITLSDQCPSRPAVSSSFTVNEVPSPSHTLDMVATTSCATGGGTSKGTVTFTGSTLKNYTAGFGWMYIYRDLDNGNPKIHLREGTQVASTRLTVTDNLSDTSRYNYTATVTNLPPGKYLLALVVGASMHSLIDRNVAQANGYMYSNLPFPAGTKIYKAFEIKNITDVAPASSVAMCNPSDANSGIVKVELPANASPQFPITYTLYKVSGGNKTIAVNGSGVQIAPITRQESDTDHNAQFNNVPKLTGSDTYEVEFKSGCLDRWITVQDFGTLDNPVVGVSATSVCKGNPLTLSVNIPESLYDIQWKSNPASALAGIPAATLKRSRFTFNATEDAQYSVDYKIKASLGCSVVLKSTDPKSVTLIRNNFTDADLSSMPSDQSLTLSLNQCVVNGSWTSPSVTDASGCGYHLTWEVQDSDGNVLHTPATDSDGNSVGTSWSSFPIGDSYVVYKVSGKISGGTTGSKKFKVTVTSNTNLSVTSAFVGTPSATAPMLSVVQKGTTVYYKVTVKNNNTQRYSGGTLRVKLPDPTVTNWELPAVTDPTIIVSDFGNVAPLGNINISYDTGDASVLILSGLDGGVLTHNSERSVYIPIKVKEGSCSGYENACLGVLTGKGEFLYEINQTQGGNTCRASGKVESAARGVAIDNSDCDREELVCAGTGNSVTLNARGTGYTSYQWYNGGSDGSSYAVIGGETGASYTATSAGFYKVEKTTTCSGATVTRSEVIEVVSSGASTSTDPISRAAGGQGGVCDSGQGPSWVSHFYLCDGNQRTLNVTFYEATQVLWQQERSGCAPTSANCLSTTDSCWTTVQSGRSFTISNAGRYRLKVERGGCSKEYYFEVFTSGLSGDMGTPVPHTDLSQGAVTVTMNTRNTQYMYTVTRVSDGALIHNGTLGPVPNGSTEFGNILNITGLVVPGSRTSDQFRIKITSSPASRFNGCKWEETVTIPYQRGMNSTVEFPNVWATNDCNKTRFDFTVTGGANPYKVLLYKIDGAYYKRSHQNVLYENIPDGDFETGITMTSTTVPHKFELWTEVPREGKYIFLIKDRDGRYAETNEVLVNQSSRYAVEITTGGNPLLCATQAGATISARFLDTTVPSPQIVLKKYKADGSLDTSFGTHTNASGQFPTTGGQPLGAGKYRIEMSYQFSHGGGTRCTIVREVEITSPEPIRASIGVVSDKNCSVDTPKQHKLKVNWVTGGVPPYQYSTGGVYSNDPELKISGATQANPKVTVYVKDSKGCIEEFEVIAANAIEEPRTLAANQVQVTYDCAGNGSFTITPTTPSGRTYVYEYGLDNQTRQSPNGGDGVSMSYTGLAGRSTPYQVKIYYKDTAATPINELYKDTFGTGDVVSCLVGSGAPTVIGCADVTGSLTPGAHLVTEQLAGGSSTYRSIAGTGRYYAVHSAIGSNRRIFEKTISNVVPARKVSVSLRYINLALASSGLSSNVGLKVSLEVENPSGGGATLFSKTLPAASLTDNWKDGELDFPELAGFNTNKTQVNLIIETTTGNAVVGLDDIRVTQPSEDCQTPKTIPVVVAPNRGFGSTLGNIEAPKCQGESGKAHVTLRNAEVTATYEYRIDSGSYQSTTLLTGDRLELAVPIGTHRIFVKMIKSATESCEIEVGEVTVVDIPKVAINSIEILPQGCVAPHLTAGATLKVQFGRAPYEVYFQESGAAAWTQATSASPYDLVWTQSNTTATFRGLDAGKSYLFKVKDANGCESLTVSQVVPTKIDLTADVLETRCLSVGATGTVTVDVNTGNGDYEFRIQKTLPTPVAWTAWAPGNQGTASQEFDGLQPGTYQIEVRDRLGCTLATSPVTVTIGDVLEFAHESDNGYDCKSPVTPENITFTMKGGVEFASGDKYRIEWKRGGTATDPTGYNPRTDTDGNNVNLTGLTAIAGGYKLEASIKTPGTYHFKLTDSKGCVRTVTEEVEAVTPAFLSSSPLVSNVIGCAGEAEGIIGISDGLNGYLPIENAIDRTRGVPPYRIEIYKYNDATYTTGETLLSSSTGRDLLAGYYKVRLKDAKECYTDQFIHVDEVTRPNATATKVQDINCAVGGQRNLGKINVTFSGAPSANYYVGLYTDNSYTMLAISGATTPAVTGELFTGVTTVNKTFEDLLEGDYYPAVINRTTGCMTPLKDGTGNPLKLTITGTSIEVTNAITTTNDCEKYEIEFKVKDSRGEIDETKLEIAFYTGAVPSATSPSWQSFTPGNTIGTGNNKQALYTRTLLRGIRYQVAVRYNSCVSIHTFEPLDIPVGNPTITQRRLPAICGSQVNFEYDVTNITTATSIDWDVYDYPMDPTAPTTASSKLSGTATVTGGKAKITGTTSSLNLIRGNQYILVVRASGASPQCAFGYKVFTITESDAPLAIVRADLVKNYNCVGSAQVSVEVKDGTGPYWYTISDVNTNPSTDEWADANVIGGTRGTPSRTAVIDKTFITTYANKIEGSVSGTTWYVHVRDAKNCWASVPITIKNDQQPDIASAEIENPCATGEYTLLVKMNKVGSGAVHYYTFTPAGGTESSRQPIQFVQVSTSPELWEGRINRVYPSTATRTLKIYDQNGCAAINTTTFEYKGRVTFNVNQTRLLSCLTTPAGAGNAVLKVSEISNLVTGYNYRYRLVRVEVGQDPITGAETTTDIPVTDGAIPSTTTTSLPDFDMITRAGRYRVDIWETTHPCPFSVTVTVRDKVEPVIALQDTDNSKCYNATPSLGASEGGTAVLYASPESIAPMTYSIIGARYASDNSAVSFTGGIPATYTNVSASNAFVTIADNGRKVTFEKLYGHINGVIYTVKAVAANGCEATTEFTIYGVKPILIDIDQARVVQFACNGDQEVMAKLSVPSGAITGGSGNYLFTLLKGGAVVTGAENVVEPSFTITDETGGSYSLRVTDARYECASVEIPFTITTSLTNLPTPDNGTTAAGTAAVANRDIDPFVKVTNIDVTEALDITCTAGESVKVDVTLSPATVATDVTIRLKNVIGGSFDHTMSITGTGSHTFTGVGMGNYSVEVLNVKTGCVVYGPSYRVQDPNTFAIAATDDKPVKCYGGNDGEITLTFIDTDLDNQDQASGGFTYTITSITNPTMTPLQATVTGNTVTLNTLPFGTYNVSAKSTVTGCQTKIPTIFSIRQADQPIYIESKVEVPDKCTGTGSAEISVVVTGGIAPYKLTIVGSNGYTQTANSVYHRWVFTGLPGAPAPTGATYTFTIEDAWGCTAPHTNSTQVITTPDPINFASVDITPVSCQNAEDGTLTVTGTTGGSPDDPSLPLADQVTTYYYELYSAGLGSIRPLQKSNEFKDLPAGNYTLTVSDRWGCVKDQSVTIGTPTPITVSFVGSQSLLCYDTTGSVQVTATGGTHSGTPTYNFELVDQSTGTVVKTEENISTLPHTIYGLKANVVYVVRATDEKGCSGTSTTLVLSTAPNLNVKASYEDECTNNEYTGNVVITFDDTTVDFSKVRYSFDGGTTKHAFTTFAGAQARINRSHSSVRPSSLPQTINLYYTDGGSNCAGETTPVVIPVVVSLSVIKDPSYAGALNELKVLGKNGVPEYTYYFNGVYYGDTSLYVVRKTDPEDTDPSDGKLKKRIDVKVIDSKGCEVEETYYMEFVEIEIPNYFTPNGDGENDTWTPMNIRQYPNIHTMIYDRYGRLIKELYQGDSWDGTYNGKDLPSGDYWYIITLGSEDDSREFKGHFTLFR